MHYRKRKTVSEKAVFLNTDEYYVLLNNVWHGARRKWQPLSGIILPRNYRVNLSVLGRIDLPVRKIKTPEGERDPWRVSKNTSNWRP
jgi:hypothetical protein